MLLCLWFNASICTNVVRAVLACFGVSIAMDEISANNGAAILDNVRSCFLCPCMSPRVGLRYPLSQHRSCGFFACGCMPRSACSRHAWGRNCVVRMLVRAQLESDFTRHTTIQYSELVIRCLLLKFLLFLASFPKLPTIPAVQPEILGTAA